MKELTAQKTALDEQIENTKSDRIRANAGEELAGVESQIEKLTKESTKLNDAIVAYDNDVTSKADNAYAEAFATMTAKNGTLSTLEGELEVANKRVAKLEVLYFEAYDALMTAEGEGSSATPEELNTLRTAMTTAEEEYHQLQDTIATKTHEAEMVRGEIQHI